MAAEADWSKVEINNKIAGNIQVGLIIFLIGLIDDLLYSMDRFVLSRNGNC